DRRAAVAATYQVQTLSIDIDHHSRWGIPPRALSSPDELIEVARSKKGHENTCNDQDHDHGRAADSIMQAKRRRVVTCLHALEGMRRVPLWLKVAYTTFVVVIIRPYLRQYGWRNFLWFSDVALFATVPALWLESPLLVSMQAVSVTIPETGWTLDLAGRQFLQVRLLGLADYMFDRRIPRGVRALSLFHL